MELLNGVTIGKHSYNLGNADTSANDREFSACPIGACFKVFHSMRIIPRQMVKVKEYMKDNAHYDIAFSHSTVGGMSFRSLTSNSPILKTASQQIFSSALVIHCFS